MDWTVFLLLLASFIKLFVLSLQNEDPQKFIGVASYNAKNTVSDSRTKIQLSFPKLVAWTWKNTDCKRRPDAPIFVAGFVDSKRLQTSLFMNDACYFSFLHTKTHLLASTLQTIAKENHDNLQYFLMRSTVTRCSPF